MIKRAIPSAFLAFFMLVFPSSRAAAQMDPCEPAEQFVETHRYTLGDYPWAVDAGDIDHDGDQDLVVTNWQGSTLHVLLNDGTGAFPIREEIALSHRPRHIRLVDFNNDSNLDMVVSMEGDQPMNGFISVWFNSGDGSFDEPVATEVDRLNDSFALTDLNGDGLIDVVSCDSVSAQVRLLQNDGNGQLTLVTSVQVGDDPRSVAMDDLNGDGHIDIVTANYIAETVSVLIANADGVSWSQTEYTMPNPPSDILIADLDQDGDLDLAMPIFGVGTNPGRYIALLHNEGDGTFPPNCLLNFGSNPRGIDAADANNDGILDLAVASFGLFGTGQYANVKFGEGSGSFLAQEYYGTGNGPTDVLFVELNDDGYIDLVVTNALDSISILLNTCGFPPACTVDLDGDGDLDFFDVSAFLLAYLSSDPIADFNGDGQFNFFDVSTFLVEYQGGCP